MYNKEMSHTHIALMTFASIALTVPFIYYAKDIARSLRVIAEKKSLENETNTQTS